MTTQRATVLGERRYYTYEPMALDPATVWQNLSHCQYAAAQALSDIRVTWDRENADTLIVAFTNPQGEQCTADLSLAVDTSADYDAADPAAITRVTLNQMECTYERCSVRVSYQRAMDGGVVFGIVDERAVMMEDISPALRALYVCVCARSERMYSSHEPQTPSLWNNVQTADEAALNQPGVILAEKRVVAYEDYLLNLQGFDIGLSQREQAALPLMSDIHLAWEDSGDPSTDIKFIGPNEFGYTGEVIPVWKTGLQARYDVEVCSDMTTKQMKRKDVYHTLPNGEQVMFEAVTGVMVLLHQLLAQCEQDGYPDFDKQTG